MATAPIHTGVARARRTSSAGSCEPKSMRARASAGGTATTAGAPVEIAYEAVWDNGTPLAADLEDFVTALTRQADGGKGD
ncbi:hypothetical protein [Streptomyces sp. NPDC057002]|uniref:hypothetical protein n=1 Tax=Streptomyces sp. NPDC057002 TaxID=3345992 RepID=UPI00363E8067